MAIENGQTCLEKRGIEEREKEIVKNDYTLDDQYSAVHPDAVSDGDVQGKGTMHGGHTHYLPDCSKDRNYIDYSNFDTANGGGKYDIDGRNGVGGRKKSLAISMYNAEHQYGANLINTSENRANGQVTINYR